MASIKGVAVENVAYHETSRGVAFHGSLLIDGTKVGTFENQGNGGMMDINVQTEDHAELRKRSEQYYFERPAEFMDVETFVEELINYYEYQEHFLALNQKEPDKALALIRHRSRTDTSVVEDMDELVPKKYKIPAFHAKAFLAKYGEELSEVFTSLSDFDIYPYHEKRLPLPEMDKGTLKLQNLQDEHEYFYQDQTYSDVLYQGITVKCTTLIIKQTHTGAYDDTALVFDLTAIPLLNDIKGYKKHFKGEQFGQYTLKDLFRIGYAFKSILLSKQASQLKGKVKMYSKGELIAY